MKLRDYIRSLDRQGLADYAARVPTTVGFLQVHVVSARKPSSLRFMRALAKATEGQVGLIEVLLHYGVPEEELRAA